MASTETPRNPHLSVTDEDIEEDDINSALQTDHDEFFASFEELADGPDNWTDLHHSLSSVGDDEDLDDISFSDRSDRSDVFVSEPSVSSIGSVTSVNSVGSTTSEGPQKSKKTGSLLKNVHVKFPKFIPKLHHTAHHERAKILRKAKALGEERKAKNAPPRHLTVVYNPISGKGIAKTIVDHMVIPVLTFAEIDYKIVPTQHRGFAIDFVHDLDLSSTNGIVVVGGDGLVREVINGLLSREDEAAKAFPIGIVPAGSANAMASSLHLHKSYSSTSLVGYAALAAALGDTRKIDVFEMESAGKKSYALSCVGWGIAGAVALKADELRWIPGQKKMRYDIAGFVTLLQDWPTLCRCRIKWLDETVCSSSGVPEWKEAPFELINMISTNLSSLGFDHPITDDIEPDDGYVKIVICDSSMDRMKVIKLAMAMKKGQPLITGEGVFSMRTKEFHIIPESGNKIPLNVDGDPIPVSLDPIRVKMLHRRLNVFASLPKTDVLLEKFGRRGHTLSINSVSSLEHERLDDYFEVIDAGPPAEPTVPVDTFRRTSIVPSYSFFDGERKSYLTQAALYGAAHPESHRHFSIVYNRYCSNGYARKVVEHLVTPMLVQAKVPFSVFVCEKLGDATRHVSGFAGKVNEKDHHVLVVGGDGIVHEVLNALMKTPLPHPTLGVLPGGTINALAHEIFEEKNPSSLEHVGELVMTALNHHSIPLDTMKVETGSETIHCHSLIGWGLPGIVGKCASDLRYSNTTCRLRYDLAGFISVTKDWPVHGKASFRYRVGDKWKEEHINVCLFLVTKLKHLGLDHGMTKDISPDDGQMAILMADSSISRRRVLKYSMALKKGHFLGEEKGVRTIFTNEFYLTPDENTIPFNFDGDPVPCAPLHVTVVPKAYQVFTKKSFIGRSSGGGIGGFFTALKQAASPRVSRSKLLPDKPAE